MSSHGISPHAGILKIKPHMATERPDFANKVRIDISSNESAYGPSQSAVEAAAQATPSMHRYSTAASHLLALKIAEIHGIDSEGVVCGHGSDDLLLRISQTFLQSGDELICSAHGYQRIPNFAYTANAQPVKAPDQDFRADVDSILGCVTERTRVVMLANPDNPTGTHLSGAEVRRLRDSLPKNVLLVLDSAYLEYVDAEDFENPSELVEESNNVVMTRTFSKIYGLAGIRLGWLYAPPIIADAVRKIGMTFPLSNVAFQAGMAALLDHDHLSYVYEKNEHVRKKFAANLQALGLDAIPSQTNFILTRFPRSDYSAEKVYMYLRTRGIFARRLASAAFSDYVRFTIGLEEEMDETADALREFLGSNPKS